MPPPASRRATTHQFIRRFSELSARAALAERLPLAMENQARHRLHVIARIMLAFVSFGLVLDVTGTLPDMATGISWLLFAITAVLYVVTGWRSVVPTKATLVFGLLSQFAYCVVVSIPLVNHISMIRGFVVEPLWTYIVMMAFPLIVPIPPLRLARSLVACSLTVPVGAYLAHTSLGTTPRPEELVGYTLTPLFVSAIVWYGAKAIYGVARAAAEAEHMGAYALQERIGAGGMGEVWRAHHQLLTRPAAIKLIKTKAEGETSIETHIGRFEREAQATALLRSPHTVQVYDFGTADDGRFFYVMELLDGLDLETLVESHGPLSAARVVHIGRQICHSLSEAHAKGLIHRDVKPANVFVCRYGEDTDFVKVLDFGLVTHERANPDHRGLTTDNVLPGTPAFLAPELVESPHQVGPSVDLYALGCVLYWLITGRLVFESETPMQAVIAHTTKEPVPPSRRSELPIPDALDALVMRLLEKSPRQRFASAREVAQALDDVPTDKTWTKADSDAWWNLHRPAARPLVTQTCG